MTVRRARFSVSFAAFVPLLAAFGLMVGCAAEKPPVYATPDYHSWKRTTDVVLDYPIPGHQDRFRIPRMNDVGFTVKPTNDNGKRHWDFPVGTIIVKEVYQTPKARGGRAAHPAHHHGKGSKGPAFPGRLAVDHP